MTKSIIGFVLLPALLMYTILTGKIREVVVQKTFWTTVAAGLGIVAAYYSVAEWLHPGHLRLVWNMELIPRYTGTMTGNWQPNFLDDKWYWVKRIVDEKFPYYWLIPLSIVAFFRPKTDDRRHFTLLMLLCAVFFLIVISHGCVIEWYDAPVYPLLSILVGMSFSDIYKGFKNTFLEKNTAPMRQNAYFLAFSLAFFAYPYYQITEKIRTTRETDAPEKFGLFLRQLKDLHPDWQSYRLLHYGYDAQVIIYVYKYRQDYGYDIQKKRIGDIEAGDIKVGDRVMLCEPDAQKLVDAKFDLKHLEGYEECQLWEVTAVK